jgi:PAS domain S-box-containing protein
MKLDLNKVRSPERDVFVSVVCVAYALLIVFVQPMIGPGIAVFGFVPVVLGGWLYGALAGAVFGFGVFVLHAAVFALLQYDLFEWMVNDGGLLGSLAIVIIGGLVGMFRDLNLRLQEAESGKKSEQQGESRNPNPVLEVDETGKIKYLNPAARQAFGDITALATGLPGLAALVNLGQIKTTNRSVTQAVVVGNRTFEFRIAFVTGEGAFRIYAVDVTSRAAAERELEGKLKELATTQAAMVGLLEDERELKEALRYERDQATQIISSMGEGLIVVNKENVITIVNPTGAKLLKMRREDIIGKQWSDLGVTTKSGDSIPVGERSFYYAMSKGITVYTNIDDDHYYKTSDGKLFPVVSITAPLTTNGKVVGAVKVFRDATYEKESRAMVEHEVEERTSQLQEAKDRISEGWLQLQQEKIKLTASINALPIGFFLLDAGHNIVVSNDVLAGILEISRGDINYEKVFGVLGAVIKDVKNICAHCRGNYTNYEATDIKYKNKVLRVFSVPVMKGTDYVGVAVLVEDETEAKMLERSKDEFFAIASHELRTPLTAIRGNTSLINEYFAESIKDPNLNEIISDIHESSVRLIEIVNDFLDVGRLEQGKVEFAKESFGVVDLTREIYHELRSVAEEKGVVLKFEEPQAGVPNALADQNKVKQVITNLVGNAIKYTKQGEVSVGISAMGDIVALKVNDTGVGISEENKRRLFGKFVQASESYITRDVTRGTGLGLYISRLLADGMGGKVYLETSELGKGSVFVFEIPAAKQ